MKKMYSVMGMTAVVEIADKKIRPEDIAEIFQFLESIDQKFSTFKKTSEVEKINRGEVLEKNYSKEMKTILTLCKKTKAETNGFFNAYYKNRLDPSGIVKGYAITQASKMLSKKGYKNFYVEIGGDIDIRGTNSKNMPWRVGIQHPLEKNQIIKVLSLKNCGIATSGSYVKGAHIYSKKGKPTSEVASVTVIGRNALEADRIATAAYAMGEDGISFIESQKNLEGYQVNKFGIATYTSGFSKFCSL